MKRILFFLSIAGFLVCLWSIGASVTRPAQFDLLTKAFDQAAASHDLSSEAKQQIDSQISLVKQMHAAEVESYSTAHHIALAGLFASSVCSFLLYLYSRRKRS